MTNEPSPRPWRVSESLSGTMSCVLDANGEHIASCFGMPTEADAALIVDAVNERDRLRDVVRRTAETLEQVYKHADMTDYLRADVAGMQREALAAIGEGETPTWKGVGR